MPLNQPTDSPMHVLIKKNNFAFKSGFKRVQAVPIKSTKPISMGWEIWIILNQPSSFDTLKTYFATTNTIPLEFLYWTENLYLRNGIF